MALIRLMTGAVTGYRNVGAIAGIANSNSEIACCSSNATINGYQDVGGLVGVLSSGTINNCQNYGSVTATLGIGGIVGASQNATISGSTNFAIITGTGRVGGILGSDESGQTTISNCSTGTGSSISGVNHVGGIVGYLYTSDDYRATNKTNSTITNCTNIAHISASNGSCIGGVVGYIYCGTIITSVSNNGNITTSGTSSLIGGIAGYSYSSQIDGTINNGNITAGDSASQVGGIVGEATQGTSVLNNTNYGVIIGYNDVGGLVGRATNASHITNGSNNGAITGAISVGGIAGSLQENSHAYGNSATHIANNGVIKGYTYVGGIVGYANSDKSSPVSIYFASNNAEVYCIGVSGSQIGVDISYARTDSGITSIMASNHMSAVGGIAGYAYATSIGHVINGQNVLVSYAYAQTFNITQNSSGTDSITVNSGALCGFGGIVGWMEGYCFLETAIIGGIWIGMYDLSETQFNGGAVLVGGFVGYMGARSIMKYNGSLNTADGTSHATNGITLFGSYFMSGAVGYCAEISNKLNSITTYNPITNTTTVYSSSSEYSSDNPTNFNHCNIVVNIPSVSWEIHNPTRYNSGYTGDRVGHYNATCGTIGAMTIYTSYYVYISGDNLNSQPYI